MTIRTVVLCTALLLPGAATADGALPFGAPLESAELDTHRAKSSQYHAQLGLLSSRAALTDNEIGTAYTGSNQVADGAFSAARGVTSVIQNTGNHVIIQDSMILNVTVNP